MTRKNATEVCEADAEGIGKAARLLADGGLVAIPTETVYGLAARADSARAVAGIYAAKGRPDFNPLIVHVASLEQAQTLADLEDEPENSKSKKQRKSVFGAIKSIGKNFGVSPSRAHFSSEINFLTFRIFVIR